MADYPDLRPLLEAFAQLQKDHAALKLVVRLLAATHQDKQALLLALDRLAELRHASDLGQPITDDDIRENQAEITKWREWIEGSDSIGKP